MCAACALELEPCWDQERGQLVVKGAVMFRHVIYHEACALTRMPPLPFMSGVLR